MPTYRIDAVVLQGIITEYDDDGRPVHESTLPPMKVFRAPHPDVWTTLDEEKRKLDTLAAQQLVNPTE